MGERKCMLTWKYVVILYEMKENSLRIVLQIQNSFCQTGNQLPKKQTDKQLLPTPRLLSTSDNYRFRLKND